eukprot:3936144-Rhodomonas_salina.1
MALRGETRVLQGTLGLPLRRGKQMARRPGSVNVWSAPALQYEIQGPRSPPARDRRGAGCATANRIRGAHPAPQALEKRGQGNSLSGRWSFHRGLCPGRMSSRSYSLRENRTRRSRSWVPSTPRTAC